MNTKNYCIFNSYTNGLRSEDYGKFYAGAFLCKTLTVGLLHY
jgi:hypothetical protein